MESETGMLNNLPYTWQRGGSDEARDQNVKCSLRVLTPQKRQPTPCTPFPWVAVNGFIAPGADHYLKLILTSVIPPFSYIYSYQNNVNKVKPNVSSAWLKRNSHTSFNPRSRTPNYTVRIIVVIELYRNARGRGCCRRHLWAWVGQVTAAL